MDSATNQELDYRIGLFDLDGTLADYNKEMGRWLKAIKSPDEPDYPFQGADRLPDHIYTRRCIIQRQPRFWLDLEPVPLGFAVIKLAQQAGFTNFHACTKGPSNECDPAWGEKYGWVRKHKKAYSSHCPYGYVLPDDMKVTVTEDKATVYGRFLCDDFVPYLEAWLKAHKRGLGVLIATDEERNKAFKHPRAVRYDGTNDDEVLMWLKKAYERQPGVPLV